MKKILSILLALSVACGSIMLTSCSEDEKEDDDDKSVSDKADKDDEDEDEDDEKSDDKDESSDEESESSKDESESSKDESESSKEESESSKDEDESSDEESESSDEEDESSEDDYDQLDNESEFVDSFEGYTVTAYGTDYEWPIKAEPFLEYFGLDAAETLDADDWDWFYYEDTYTELDIFNPSAEEATAYADCYIDYLYWTVDDTDLDVTVNGVGIGSTLDEINEAFAMEFTLDNGWVEIWDDEYWGNEANFLLEDGVVVEVEIRSDDEYFFSDDEIIDDGGDVDDEEAEYTAGQTVEFGGISFVVPEGFEGYQSYDDTLDFEAMDETTFSQQKLTMQATTHRNSLMRHTALLQTALHPVSSSYPLSAMQIQSSILQQWIWAVSK